MNQQLLLLFYVLCFSFLSACSSGRYQHKNDSIPTRLPSQAELKDALPRAEPYSRGGNKDYQVFGKSYKVLNAAHGFKQTGIASWYGKKFHGHLTSNGEIYDMYTMSAAHKNLPLPTYLKVTNTDNNKSIIVRVNDRGPFHQSRIIDLSYSAAYQLDMLKTGTAHVKIAAITNFDKKTGKIKVPVELIVTSTDSEVGSEIVASTLPTLNNSDTPMEKVTLGITTPYIQVFATRNKELAISTADKLKNQYKQQTSYPEQEGVYRIQVGPLNDLSTLNALLLALKKNGYPNAYPRTASL
jgi:rare lipoprotein A